MTSETRLELQRMLSALCDGELSQQQSDRLEELLAAEDECRRMYLEYVDMHARLLARPQGVEAPIPAKRVIRIPQLLRYAAVAAVTLAASLLVQAYWFNPTPAVGRIVSAPAQPPLEPRMADYVATLTQAANCVWEAPQEAQRVGSRLTRGELRLADGVAHLRFESGPELLIAGPATIRLDSSSEATILRGRVMFRGSETAAPFKLKTPTSTLVDLGTEYAVVVGPEGEEVYVLDGEVQRTPSSSQSAPEHLAAGEGRRYAGEPASGQPAEFDPSAFARLLSDDDPLPADPTVGLLAYEGFDYGDAQLLPDGAADAGSGWAGPWRCGFARPRNEGDTNTLALNVKQSLTRTGTRGASLGGAFDYTGFTKYFRRMTTPIRMDTESVYYVSFLFLREGPPEELLNSSCILLRTDEELELEHMGLENRRERLNIGIHRVNHLFTHLHGVEARISLPLSYGETYLLVAKIVASDSEPDQVFIRVYGPEEPVEREESAAWTMVGPEFHSDLVFDWFEVHINSVSRKVLDEIRVGTTWSSVAGPWIAAPKE